jgi:two-component system, chemotaxis family, CheB/CheR fusion protein
VNLEVVPLKNLRERCFLILFEDAGTAAPAIPDAAPRERPVGTVNPPRPARKKDESRRVARLERELSETRDYLQSIQELHEAADEELQASNEEVQSANEELQSINEELETSKEELESANEELITVNEEMANRNTELNRLNNDLVNLQTSSRLAILLLGRDLTIRRFSAQAEKQFNLMAADVGRPISSIRHNLKVSALENIVAEVVASVRESEREVRGHDGRWYSLRVRPYLTLDNIVDGAVIVLVDIDELKRVQRAIVEARQHAEAIIRTVPDPLVILNADLRVQSANDAFYRTFKLSAAEVEGRSILELDHGSLIVPRLRQLLEDIIPRNSFFNDFEVMHKFERIGRRSLLLNARMLSEPGSNRKEILLGIRDISEVLTFQADLRRSELRYRRHFESARDGVLLVDPTTRQIIDANPFMTELLGYTRGELCGKELFEIGLLKDRAASETAFRQLQEEGQIRFEDLPLQTKTGQRRDVEFVSNQYHEDGERIIQCNIRDITGRVKAEAALRESLRWVKELYEAAEAERASAEAAKVRAEAATQAKDDFLAALSHELRTPLSPPLLLATALSDDPALPPHIRADIETIGRGISLQVQLIDDLLDLTSITSGKLRLELQPVDAHEVIRRTLELVESEIRERRIGVTLDLSAGHHFICADALRMHQILWNVLKNAAKFTPPGGTITLRTFQPADNDRAVVMEVSDTGIGIAPEMLEKIFDSFAQEHSDGAHCFGGLGLGLAITRRLVELQHGRIDACSDGRGHGATFRIEMPVVSPAVEATASAATPVSASPKAPARRILLLEDHEMTREALVRLLERRGHTVFSAGTAGEARALAAPGECDLVISDLGLPDGDGHAFMASIRDTHGLPGIALSGYGAEEDLRRSRESGFFTHLTKPVNIHALESAIAAAPFLEHEQISHP